MTFLNINTIGPKPAFTGLLKWILRFVSIGLPVAVGVLIAKYLLIWVLVGVGITAGACLFMWVSKLMDHLLASAWSK